MNLNNYKSKKIMVAIIISIIILILIAIFVVTQIGPYNKNNKEDIVVDIPTGSTLSQVTDILKENKLIKNKILFKLYVRVSNNTNKNNKEDIVVDIPTGSTLSQVTDILKENKLIKNKILFKLYVRVSNNTSKLKSGKYLFNQTYSNKDIVQDLSEGKVYNDGIKITVPEGSTSFEIVDILVKNKLGDKNIYEKLINNPKEFKEKFNFLDDEKIISLEGFLYPSTYYFDEDQSEKEVLNHMLETFESKYNDKLQKRQKELNKSLYEVIDLASIVEKEAVLDEDRPIIASVFYNRINIGMPLQSDATIQYIFKERKKSITYNDLKIDSPYNTYKVKGLPPTPIANPMPLQSDATIQYIFKERKKSITYNDLKIDSPYNTYKVKGLPPTPIANPGIESIEAVLYPSTTEYLYFVATIEGGNTYSKTYEEHVKNVEQYRKDREERNNSYSTDK